jgi:hypothetical protein
VIAVVFGGTKLLMWSGAVFSRLTDFHEWGCGHGDCLGVCVLDKILYVRLTNRSWSKPAKGRTFEDKT